MFDLPFKLFPPALLGGLAIYGAVTVLWLQPIVESRMAEKHLIPQCRAVLHQKDTARVQQPDPERDAAKMLLRVFKETGMDQLPGVSESLELGEKILDAKNPKRLRRSSIVHASICACAVDTSFEEVGWAMTLYVASARSHVPASIRQLSHTIQSRAHSSRCTKLSANQ